MCLGNELYDFMWDESFSSPPFICSMRFLSSRGHVLCISRMHYSNLWVSSMTGPKSRLLSAPPKKKKRWGRSRWARLPTCFFSEAHMGM